MKFKIRLISIFLLFSSIFLHYANNNEVLCMAEYNKNESEIVMERDSGRILYASNSKIKRPMASTTKILTAIIIIEDCDLNKNIKIPAKCVGIEGSSVYLKAGDEYTIKDLLYGLLLRSGNDCAETLACIHSGSIEKFAEQMNLRAKSMGAKNSNFVNPHGLPNEQHYTTAEDLALISCYAMKNPIFRKIASTKLYSSQGWNNKNKMLYNFDGANGIKTGFTKQAGRCLVSSAERDNMTLVCVVLNCPDMWERSSILLEDAYKTYHLKQVCFSNEKLGTIPSTIKNKECRFTVLKDFYYPLADGEEVQTFFELPSKVQLPIYKDDVIGKICITLGNQLIFSENLVSIEDVKKSYLDILQEMVEYF